MAVFCFGTVTMRPIEYVSVAKRPSEISRSATLRCSDSSSDWPRPPVAGSKAAHTVTVPAGGEVLALARAATNVVTGRDASLR